MLVVGSLILAGLVAIGSGDPVGLTCHMNHEIFVPCHRPCTPSCDDPNPTCEGACVEGCVCQEPYVRGRDGHCVLFDGCGGGHHHGHHHGHHGHHGHHRHGRGRRWKCGPNEKFKRCKRTCEQSCKKRKPKNCGEPCIDWGCQCESGFVRDRHGDCIPYDLCPNRKHKCSKNERWSNETNVPERKCQEPRCENQRYPKKCPRYSTNGGCVCKDTYVRDNRGKCVKHDQCRDRSHSRSHSHDDSWDDSWDDSRDSHSRSRDSHWDSDSDSHDYSPRSWSHSRSGSWDRSHDRDSWDGDESRGRHRRRGHGRGRHGRHGRHGRRHRGHHHHHHNECHCHDKFERLLDKRCRNICSGDSFGHFGHFGHKK